jgi:hypothetical protein
VSRVGGTVRVTAGAAASSAACPGCGAVWDGNGQLEHAGLIGDAAEHLLTTPSGAIWAGYFDEGIYGPTPAAHGLVRFAPEPLPERGRHLLPARSGWHSLLTPSGQERCP